MKNYFYPSVVLLLFFTIILGIVYPILMAQIGDTFWNFQAQGSLLKKNNLIIGSELIGQEWKKSIYFRGRPSVSQYNPMSSGASNLAPINLQIDQHSAMPQELRLSSGSGLDPHLSKEAIFYQIPAVAKARKMNEEALAKLVLSLIEKKVFGVLGQERVNVLKLNLMLDNLL